MTGVHFAAVEAEFARLAAERFGLSFVGGRRAALGDGVTRASADLGLSETELLRLASGGDARGLDALARAWTVGESYFLRQPAHFQWLSSLLQEQVIKRGQARIVIWSAGCSSGEEPYSMAITALETLGANAKSQVQIIATDLNPNSLSRAKEGLYRRWSFRGVSEDSVTRWFHPEGQELRITEAPRELVRFESLNLMKPDEARWPRDVDVIFCRNVCVYFDDEGLSTVSAGFRKALSPGGYLMCGAGDPSLDKRFLSACRRPDLHLYQAAEEADEAEKTRPPPTPRRVRRATSAAISRVPVPRAFVKRRRPVIHSAPTEPAVVEAADPVEPTLAGLRRLANAAAPADAIEALSRALVELPFEPELYLLRSLVHQSQDAHVAAVRDARRALLLDRSSLYAHLVLAQSAIAWHRVSLARRSLRSAKLLASSVDADSVVPYAGGLLVQDLLEMLTQLDGAAVRLRGEP